MKPTDFPLAVAKDIQDLFRAVRKFQLANSDKLEINQGGSIIIGLKTRDDLFYFNLSNPSQDTTTGKPYYYVEYRPYSPATKEQKKVSGNFTDILFKMEGWLKLIREYDSVTREEADFIEKAYEEEFYSEYDIVDEDADIKPFTSAQQEKLDQFFNKLIENLEREKANYPVEPIIAKAKEIKQELPISTKKKVVKAMGKMFAEMKKLGVEAMKKFTAEKAQDLLKLAFEVTVQVLKHQ